MNRVDVVDLVVDLVDVDLDVDLVDVVSLSSGCIFIFWPLGPRQYFNFLAPRKKTNCVTPENVIFEILKELGLKSDPKLLVDRN